MIRWTQISGYIAAKMNALAVLVSEIKEINGKCIIASNYILVDCYNLQVDHNQIGISLDMNSVIALVSEMELNTGWPRNNGTGHFPK